MQKYTVTLLVHVSSYSVLYHQQTYIYSFKISPPLGGPSPNSSHVYSVRGRLSGLSHPQSARQSTLNPARQSEVARCNPTTCKYPGIPSLLGMGVPRKKQERSCSFSAFLRVGLCTKHWWLSRSLWSSLSERRETLYFLSPSAATQSRATAAAAPAFATRPQQQTCPLLFLSCSSSSPFVGPLVRAPRGGILPSMSS